MQAFKDCAEENQDFYEWLDEISKTSMIVPVVEKLHELGYNIKRTHYPLFIT